VPRDRNTGDSAGGTGPCRRSRSVESRSAQDAAQFDVQPARPYRRGVDEAASRAAELWCCRRSGSVAGSGHFNAAAVGNRCHISSPRVRYRLLDTTDEVTELSGTRLRSGVAVRALTREGSSYTLYGHSIRQRVRLIHENGPTSSRLPRRAFRFWSSRRAQHYRKPRKTPAGPHVQRQRHAHWLKPEPKHLWAAATRRLPAHRVITIPNRSGEAAGRGIDHLLAGVVRRTWVTVTRSRGSVTQASTLGARLPPQAPPITGLFVPSAGCG